MTHNLKGFYCSKLFEENELGCYSDVWFLLFQTVNIWVVSLKSFQDKEP